MCRDACSPGSGQRPAGRGRGVVTGAAERAPKQTSFGRTGSGLKGGAWSPRAPLEWSMRWAQSAPYRRSPMAAKAGVPVICAGCAGNAWYRAGDRDSSGASEAALKWPNWRATCPGLPSGSSICKDPGRRPAAQKEINPQGVYLLKRESYHSRSVNVL